MNEFKVKKGFSLVELVIIIAILSIVLLISVYHWGSISSEQALLKDKLGIISIFEQARSLAVSSKGNSDYGVNISSTTAYIFKGSVFDPSAPVVYTYSMNRFVQVSVVSVSGGSNNIFFSRLSGNTNQTGSIKISLIQNPNSSTTITILGSGVVQ